MTDVETGPTETTGLLVNGSAASQPTEESILKTTGSRKFSWGLVYVLGFLLGIPMFIAFFVLAIVHSDDSAGTLYLILMGVAAVFVVLGYIGKKMIRRVQEAGSIQVKKLKVANGDFLLRSEVPEDQWLSFHRFDATQKTGNALAAAIGSFIGLGAVLCLNLALRAWINGVHIPGAWYGYILAADFVVCLIGYVIAAIIIVVKRQILSGSKDRVVYLFPDAAMYEGFFIDWIKHQGELKTGVRYLHQVAIASDSQAGYMLKIKTFKKSGKTKGPDSIVYLPIAEIDLKKAREIVPKI